MLPARPPKRMRRNIDIPDSPVGGQGQYDRQDGMNWIRCSKGSSMLAEKLSSDKLGPQSLIMPSIKLPKPKNQQMLALPPLSAQNKFHQPKLNFVELNKRLLANRSASIHKPVTKSSPLNEDISLILKQTGHSRGNYQSVQEVEQI